MKSFDYVIKDEMGIHARPAGLIVKQAKQYSSTITLICGEKKAVAKGLMGVMALTVKKGNTVTVTAEGEDEAVAIEAMKEFFEQNL